MIAWKNLGSTEFIRRHAEAALLPLPTRSRSQQDDFGQDQGRLDAIDTNKSILIHAARDRQKVLKFCQ